MITPLSKTADRLFQKSLANCEAPQQMKEPQGDEPSLRLILLADSRLRISDAEHIASLYPILTQIFGYISPDTAKEGADIPLFHALCPLSVVSHLVKQDGHANKIHMPLRCFRVALTSTSYPDYSHNFALPVSASPVSVPSKKSQLLFPVCRRAATIMALNSSTVLTLHESDYEILFRECQGRGIRETTESLCSRRCFTTSSYFRWRRTVSIAAGREMLIAAASAGV